MIISVHVAENNATSTYFHKKCVQNYTFLRKLGSIEIWKNVTLAA